MILFYANFETYLQDLVIETTTFKAYFQEYSQLNVVDYMNEGNNDILCGLLASVECDCEINLERNVINTL